MGAGFPRSTAVPAVRITAGTAVLRFVHTLSGTAKGSNPAKGEQEWAYFLNKLKSVRERDGTLLDHTLVGYGSSGGAINAHDNHHLPAMLAGGSRPGVRHQGHLVKEGVRLGNLWSRVFDRMNVPLPRNFQGGEADGIIRELDPEKGSSPIQIRQRLDSRRRTPHRRTPAGH